MKFRLILVITGILMTVTSAVITNHLLEKNNIEISALNKESAVIEKQISDRWQFLQDSQGKLDLAISVLAGKSTRSKGDNKIVNQYFYDWFTKIDTNEDNKILQNSNIEGYIALVEGFKDDSISNINDLYLTKLSIEGQKLKILENNMFLKNLALLFQILGLIFVLSRNT